MVWRVGLLGRTPIECKGQSLKGAVSHYFESTAIPENGHLMVQNGSDQFQLVIKNYAISHNGEAIFGSPGEPPAGNEARKFNGFAEPARDTQSNNGGVGGLMTIVLWLASAAAVFTAIYWFDNSAGAMHEATGAVFFLIGAVCCVGAVLNTSLIALLNKRGGK